MHVHRTHRNRLAVCGQGGERRLRPDARTSALLIAVLQALQRLVSCPQLQEEVCVLRLFGSLFSLLDCGCDRVAMEAARLLARLWAPEAFLSGSKPFVNKTAGEEYRFNKPEDAIQVCAATPGAEGRFFFSLRTAAWRG